MIHLPLTKPTAACSHLDQNHSQQIATSTSAATPSSQAMIRNVDGELITVPHEYICPITMELMHHPMATRYGHTYERNAIVQWISSGNGYCPLTRTPLSYSDIIPHRQMEKKIVCWKARNKIADLSLSSILATQEDRAVDFVGVLQLNSQQQGELHSFIANQISTHNPQFPMLQLEQQQQQQQPKNQRTKVKLGLRGLFRLGSVRSSIKTAKDSTSEELVATETSSSSSLEADMEADMENDTRSVIKFHDDFAQRQYLLKALADAEQSFQEYDTVLND
jgi:hypothetical protein